MKAIPVLLPLLALGLAACTGPVVRYGDARAPETVTAEFGSTDLQTIANGMVKDLLDSRRLRPDPAAPDQAPLVTVTRLRNRTSEHIDTKAITDSIRTALVKSGQVRFSANDQQEDLVEQLKHQAAWADPRTAKEMGRQEGSRYVLGGDLTSIVKQNGRVKDVYFKITLQVTDLQTAVIAWANEVEIRKESVRRLFGR
jgi:penicillin-binding protein activator